MKIPAELKEMEIMLSSMQTINLILIIGFVCKELSDREVEKREKEVCCTHK